MGDREFKRDRHLPARYEGERIFHKDAYNEWAFNAFGLCGGKDLLCVRARGNPSIAFYRHPLTGKRSAISFNHESPRGAIAARTLPDGIPALPPLSTSRHYPFP